LIQAQFGCINLNDFSLNQDLFRIQRAGQRISRCKTEFKISYILKIFDDHLIGFIQGIFEYLQNNDKYYDTETEMYIKYEKSFNTLLNSIMLHKCFVTRLWHDSPYVFKQFTGIGATLSQALVNNGVVSFAHVLKYDSMHLDRILNRTGFGAQILKAVKSLPHFRINFNLIKSESDKIILNVICEMENYECVKENDILGLNNPIMFVAGDCFDNLICSQRLK
jgi:hypothetical protein